MAGAKRKSNDRYFDYAGQGINWNWRLEDGWYVCWTSNYYLHQDLSFIRSLKLSDRVVFYLEGRPYGDIKDEDEIEEIDHWHFYAIRTEKLPKVDEHDFAFFDFRKLPDSTQLRVLAEEKLDSVVYSGKHLVPILEDCGASLYYLVLDGGDLCIVTRDLAKFVLVLAADLAGLMAAHDEDLRPISNNHLRRMVEAVPKGGRIVTSDIVQTEGETSLNIWTEFNRKTKQATRYPVTIVGENCRIHPLEQVEAPKFLDQEGPWWQKLILMVGLLAAIALVLGAAVFVIILLADVAAWLYNAIF